jgi:nucleoside-diphosphate-sugar epimerase
VDAKRADGEIGPILVIGGSGRTGRKIVDRLRAESRAVRVLARQTTALDAEMVVGSITDRDDVGRAASDAVGS